jgi:hypothetical protein
MEEAIDGIDEQMKRYHLTLEALADVYAGRVVEHAAVQAWAASLVTDEPPLPLPKC